MKSGFEKNYIYVEKEKCGENAIIFVDFFTKIFKVWKKR